MNTLDEKTVDVINEALIAYTEAQDKNKKIIFVDNTAIKIHKLGLLEQEEEEEHTYAKL